MSTLTKPVSAVQYRVLRFASIDDLTSEVDRLAALDQAGQLQSCGRWTLGQCLGHLATWISYAYQGAPFKVPFFIRWILKTRRNQFFNGPMPHGVKIPRVKGGTFGVGPLSVEEGLEKFRSSITQLRDQAPILPHPIFGQLTHEAWIKTHLRHAELHLGYFNGSIA